MILKGASASTAIAVRRIEGADLSRHVTGKFDADADADFADEYNLEVCST